jgi:arsenate reductase (thioredoxin)
MMEGRIVKSKVLFLCTGNSCRSQIAEAIVNARLSEQWEAQSAGTRPAGYVHPMAIQVLQEIGIVHAGHSKSVDEIRDILFDLVVTVCDSAAEECPVWLGSGRRIHMGFPDPAKATGSYEQIIAEFRSVRDSMSQEILAFLEKGASDAPVDHEQWR